MAGCGSKPWRVDHAVHDETIDPILVSDNYAIGTWTFHGSGFDATPFVHKTATRSLGLGRGSVQWSLRGALATDGTVPGVAAPRHHGAGCEGIRHGRRFSAQTPRVALRHGACLWGSEPPPLHPADLESPPWIPPREETADAALPLTAGRFDTFWRAQHDSNVRPPGPQPDALSN